MTKYDFTDSPEPEKEQVEEVKRASVEEMIACGRKHGMTCITTGKQHFLLQQAAQAHAESQAQLDQLGHQEWESRSRLLADLIPGVSNLREVVAWTGYQASGAVGSLLESWWTSKKHRAIVYAPCDIYGLGIAYNDRTRTFYACAIVADRRT